MVGLEPFRVDDTRERNKVPYDEYSSSDPIPESGVSLQVVTVLALCYESLVSCGRDIESLAGLDANNRKIGNSL